MEVLGAHVTRCVIVSGAQKVVPSVEKGSSLIVVSDSQSLFLMFERRLVSVPYSDGYGLCGRGWVLSFFGVYRSCSAQ